MKTTISSLITAAFIAIWLNAFNQQVVATAGDYFEGENISLSWTLGETVIETLAGDDIILTQGFQQPYNFYFTQILNIPAGWSGVSGYIDPANKGLENLFDAHPEFIFLGSMSGFYCPDEGINTLGEWDYQTGYMIKADSLFDLRLNGNRIDSPTVDLKDGWNLMPVLTSCGATTSEVFGEMTNVTIVKEVAGPLVYWPEFSIQTLENLQAGKAYFVKMSGDTSFTYPECDKSIPILKHPQQPPNFTPWNNLNYTSVSHTIAFPSKVLSESGIQPGDYIGAFTPQEYCAGRTEIFDLSSSVALVAFANDECTINLDGFFGDEIMQFKVYRPTGNREFVLDVAFDPAMPNSGVFEHHGISAAKWITLNPSSTQEVLAIKSKVFPNPSNGLIKLSMCPWPDDLQLQLMDTRGQLIKIIGPVSNPEGKIYEIDLQELQPGIYILKLIFNSTMTSKKIIIY